MVRNDRIGLQAHAAGAEFKRRRPVGQGAFQGIASGKVQLVQLPIQQDAAVALLCAGAQRQAGVVVQVSVQHQLIVVPEVAAPIPTLAAQCAVFEGVDAQVDGRQQCLLGVEV